MRIFNWVLPMLVIACISLLTAGCWDYQELEDRAIIVGLGIDELPPVRSNGFETRMYQVVVQIVEAAAEDGGDQKGGGFGSSGKQSGYTNFVIETPSIADGIERVVTRSDRLPNMSHLQTIALGEKVARKGINELYDFFARFPQMRRHTEMLVFDGPISQLFATPSVSEPTPALHIAEMIDNVQRTIVMPVSNLGTVSKSVRSQSPFLLVKAAMNENKEILINQVAVFDTFKMIGTLSREQMMDISVLQDEIERGVLHFPCYQGKKTGLQIIAGNCKIKPELREGHPHITFDVELEGEMMEYQCLGASFEKPEQIKRLEQIVSDMLRIRLKRTAEKVRNKYGVDVLRLRTRLKNERDLYKELRQRPSEFFRRLTIDVKADVKIRNIGNNVQTPNRELRPK
ncbi:Ger(x)C family spore germination protein [Brevibacillus migulae]|uniref:Ger(x)C family spore germination protein n=1 Tax=Brevibacillus migulae TaxID=1644114 RepID=UPI001F3E3400|nr:Ger(x)C family spore germination protein [Brevibacillus migulae]